MRSFYLLRLWCSLGCNSNVVPASDALAVSLQVEQSDAGGAWLIDSDGARFCLEWSRRRER